MIKFLNKFFKPNQSTFKNKAEFKQLVIRKEVKELFQSFYNFSNKAELRFVGGCVRKLINNEKVDDIDMSTNLKPDEVIKVFKQNKINFHETGINHGTVTAVINDSIFEITSLRKDIKTDGRHAQVEYTEKWLEDAARRDFTINAIYSDKDGNLFDPFNGKKDLAEGHINFIGDPATRIKEDYLRILRYIRFYLSYSKIKHNKNTVKSIKQNLSGLKHVSKDRQLHELKKIISLENFYKINSDKTIKELFLLIFPELKNINRINKLENSILRKKSFEFILSVLLVDSSEDCDYFIYKYNFSNKEKNKINLLNSIFSVDLKKDYFTKENLSKIMHKYGKDNLVDILDFKILLTKKNKNFFNNLKNYFLDFEIPIIPVQAKDLIKRFDLKEGKLLGLILKEIETQWLENNFQITNNQIEEIVKSKRI